MFRIWKDGSPFAAIKVVNERNTDSVSTEQQWTVFAIVNGITTDSVVTNNPEATINATVDNNDDGFSLVVS